MGTDVELSIKGLIFSGRERVGLTLCKAERD